MTAPIRARTGYRAERVRSQSVFNLVKSSDTGNHVTFRIEGRLIAPWLSTLEAECRGAIEAGKRVTLDLSSLTYVGPTGIALLRELAAQSVVLTNASPLIAEMLQSI